MSLREKVIQAVVDAKSTYSPVPSENVDTWAGECWVKLSNSVAEVIADYVLNGLSKISSSGVAVNASGVSIPYSLVTSASYTNVVATESTKLANSIRSGMKVSLAEISADPTKSTRQMFEAVKSWLDSLILLHDGFVSIEPQPEPEYDDYGNEIILDAPYIVTTDVSVNYAKFIPSTLTSSMVDTLTSKNMFVTDNGDGNVVPKPNPEQITWGAISDEIERGLTDNVITSTAISVVFPSSEVYTASIIAPSAIKFPQ